jgi:hypothetical protein|tara:strand:+ start:952 stop:1182 length:231 start_codon:yes stop_codon:yes gene_type:complete
MNTDNNTIGITVRADYGYSHSYLVAEAGDGDTIHHLSTRIAGRLPTRGVEFESAANAVADRLAEKHGWSDYETEIH